jgi:hypothetical protein
MRACIKIVTFLDLSFLTSDDNDSFPADLRACAKLKESNACKIPECSIQAGARCLADVIVVDPAVFSCDTVSGCEHAASRVGYAPSGHSNDSGNSVFDGCAHQASSVLASQQAESAENGWPVKSM